MRITTIERNEDVEALARRVYVISKGDDVATYERALLEANPWLADRMPGAPARTVFVPEQAGFELREGESSPAPARVDDLLVGSQALTRSLEQLAQSTQHAAERARKELELLARRDTSGRLTDVQKTLEARVARLTRRVEAQHHWRESLGEAPWFGRRGRRSD